MIRACCRGAQSYQLEPKCFLAIATSVEIVALALIIHFAVAKNWASCGALGALAGIDLLVILCVEKVLRTSRGNSDPILESQIRQEDAQQLVEPSDWSEFVDKDEGDKKNGLEKGNCLKKELPIKDSSNKSFLFALKVWENEKNQPEFFFFFLENERNYIWRQFKEKGY